MFLKYLFIFALFSIVGWILELLYRSFKVKKIINPGFMCGCVVPIYGFAAVILTFICEILNKIETDVKIFIILILSFIILTLLELISGVLMSKIFSLKLWDYKNKPFNYKGYVCLEFSSYWMVLSLIYYMFIYPFINIIAINFTNNKFGLIIIIIFYILFIIDFIITINISSRLTKYAKNISEIIDLDKFRIEVRKRLKNKKILNLVHADIGITTFIKEKLKEMDKD